MKRQPLRAHCACEDLLVQNLGDSLVPIILQALGFQYVRRNSQRSDTINGARCLVATGSALAPENLALIPGSLDIWGAGWKGDRLERQDIERLRVYAVAGPHSVRELGLSSATPVGDPSLLLPALCPRTIKTHGKTIVVPHALRATRKPAGIRRRLTGCAEVISPWVFGSSPNFGLSAAEHAVSSILKHLNAGVVVKTTWSTIQKIAGASFVLSGSLHAAMLAQTYSVPWAAYDDGYVDAPPKWYDWAAYLGINLDFVRNLEKGKRWWESHGVQGRMRSLNTLLAAFPYKHSFRGNVDR